MIEVTKYKNEFSNTWTLWRWHRYHDFCVDSCLFVVKSLNLPIPLEVCIRIQYIPSFFYSLLLPPRYLPNSASLKNIGCHRSRWSRCGPGVSCEGPGDHWTSYCGHHYCCAAIRTPEFPSEVQLARRRRTSQLELATDLREVFENSPTARIQIDI